jgi:hypothetical protein
MLKDDRCEQSDEDDRYTRQDEYIRGKIPERYRIGFHVG